MVFLHVANIDTSILGGVQIAVPQMVKAQSRYAKVALLNTFGEKISDIDTFSFEGMFDIDRLPQPFNSPDLVIFHEIYRQFVNVLYPTEEFAFYSFAYNIVSMISTMVASISIVLLPMLKKIKKEQVVHYYRKSLIIVLILVASLMTCYFPLVIFVKWFLPDYIISTEYIRIVLPSILFTSGITVVMFTIVKTLDVNRRFFSNGCIILGLGFIANTVAYFVWNTPKSISYASLLVMIIWFLAEGEHLKKVTQIKVYKELIYLLMISVGFLFITALEISFIFMTMLYLIIFVLITLCFYRSFIKNMIMVTRKH